MRILVFLILLYLFPAKNASEFYPEKQAIKVVKSVLKEKDISLIHNIQVKNKTGNTRTIVLYQFSGKAGENFYVAFTQANGRYNSFDYLVMVSNKYEVQKVRILKYRSEYGGEIASKKWLQQFENYSSGKLRYKKEISALSGATISANSLVADIPIVLKILIDSCN